MFVGSVSFSLSLPFSLHDYRTLRPKLLITPADIRKPNEKINKKKERNKNEKKKGGTKKSLTSQPPPR